MYFDPPESQKLSPKPPELSPREIATAEGEFIANVQRELTIRGESSKTIHGLMIEMRDRLTVTPRFAGAETRYRSRHGGRLNAKQAAEAIVEEAAERDRMAAYGPDPEELLRKRLVDLGIPEAEARSRAAGRVSRLEDGRVIARKANGDVLYHGGPVPQPGRKYTEEEKSLFTDAGRALRLAASAIAEERERGIPADSSPMAHSGSQNVTPSEEAIQQKRNMISGAL